MGLGTLYSGMRLLPGQDVLTTEHDFFATHESLRLLAARTGAKVRRARLYDDPAKASADEMVSRLKAALGPRTRVVAITWVHSGTGVRMPVRAIADMSPRPTAPGTPRTGRCCASTGCTASARWPTGWRSWGCDFLASGTHKWLFGPRGTGILWGGAGPGTRCCR